MLLPVHFAGLLNYMEFTICHQYSKQSADLAFSVASVTTLGSVSDCFGH